MTMRSVRYSGHTFLPCLSATSTVLDLGANVGAFSHAVIGEFGSRVFAAEPLPENAAAIPSHPKLTVMEIAVGETDGLLPLHVAKGSDPTERDGLHEGADAIAAPCMTLRSFRNAVGAADVDLLKVDIEGSEIGLFAGAEDADFADIPQITMEFHAFMDPRLAAPSSDLCKRLSRHFLVNPMSLDGADVLFLNRKRFGAADRYRLVAEKYWRGIARRIGRRHEALATTSTLSLSKRA